ncbi:MAG: signal recognition particle-docking protein FtsY [Candidatus Micrarchaeia archaeon]
MFDELKKKLVSLVKNFSKDEEEKEEAQESKEEPIQKVELGISNKIKKVLKTSIHLNDKEIEKFSSNIMNTLLEAEVSYEAAEAFSSDISNTLKGRELPSGKIEESVMEIVKNEVEKVLAKAMPSNDFVSMIKELASKEKPVKLLFLGPNGAGKTTTIAKIAYMLGKEGMQSALSASDTFRAAAIEQLEIHASRLNVPIIKGKYGADPASVAFDAIAYSKARSIDVVLIDTAGRQETNKNLLNEIAKIARVSKPDLAIYIGESTAGSSIIDQIREFDKVVKINGLILTKIDCDLKGGSLLSLAYALGLPIFFIGTGESYESLINYEPRKIVSMLLS